MTRDERASICDYWRDAHQRADGETVVRGWLCERWGRTCQNDAWVDLCAEGDQELAEWVSGLVPIDPHHNQDRAWREAAEGRRLEVIRWLSDLGISTGLVQRTAHLVPEVARLVRELSPHRLRYATDTGVTWCRLSQGSVRPHVEETWMDAWRGGDRERAANLWDQDREAPGPVDAIWQRVCENEELELAEWIYSRAASELDHQRAWYRAARGGRLLITQWLWLVTDPDPLAGDTVFHCACRNGHLETAQWLWSLGVYDLHQDDDACWRWTCRRGRVGVAHWLWDLGGIDHRARDDEAWRWACCEGHLELVEWILDLGVSEHSVCQWLEIGDVEVAAVIRRWCARRRHKSARSVVRGTADG